jgi:hypothetical protein
VIATPSFTDRSPASLVSAQDGLAGKGSFKAAGEANQQPIDFRELLQQSSARAAVEEHTSSLGGRKKDGSQKKDNLEASGLDANTLEGAGAVASDNLQIWLPFTPKAEVASQARLEPTNIPSQTTTLTAASSGLRSSATQTGAVFPGAVPVSGSSTNEEFCVKLNNTRGTGSSAELAFALRLKSPTSAAKSVPDPSVPAGGPDIPLTAAKVGVSLPGSAKAGGLIPPMPETQNAPFPSVSRGLETESGETSAGVSGNLSAAQSGNESGSDPRSGDHDSSREKQAASRHTVLSDQLEKAVQTGRTETPAPVQSANVRGPAQESLITPPAHAATSPAVQLGSAAPKAAAQAAPPPAATSLDLEDRPATVHPAQEISLQISSADDRKVDVRLVQRAGEVLVTVRTPDVALAHDLRQDLGSLTGKLAQAGYGTEQFTPISAGSSNLSNQPGTPENQDSSRGHGQNPQHGGSGQQQQPQDERGRRPDWVEEMENSLAHRQANRSTTWSLTR